MCLVSSHIYKVRLAENGDVHLHKPTYSEWIYSEFMRMNQFTGRCNEILISVYL